MAKVIFEFEIGEDDDLIEIHHNARRMASCIEELAASLRTKLKHAPNDAQRNAWLPMAVLFKQCIAHDLYQSPVATDYELATS